MKKIIAITLIILLLPVFDLCAQSGGGSATEFDMTTFPQWARDMRRWEIVAFGSFPFTMLIATTAMDMYRWNNANGMSFDDMRYAPWPLKPAGAIPMDNSEMEATITIAIGLSVAVAITDLIIVLIKRENARRKAQAIPVGTTIITRTPQPEESPEAAEDAGTDEPEH